MTTSYSSPHLAARLAMAGAVQALSTARDCRISGSLPALAPTAATVRHRHMSTPVSPACLNKIRSYRLAL
ncbi:MAG: hypothetical protein ACYDD7_03010, partial [Acidimicrobiales bacterium]